ncbi:MAG: 30S ribosomal protein S1 [Candidatus Ancillula sp.]|jgi:small subunit ribosomal protein S1|nr:30S ribosomal protein S1 [Candidatus Ancillula sp.]
MAAKKEAAVAVNDFKSTEDMLAEIDKTLKSFKDGDVLTGEIVKIDRDEVLVDVKYKTEGVIPAKELSLQKNARPEDVVNIGDTVDALVIQKEDKEGRLILSKKRAVYEKAWTEAQKVKDEDGIIEGKVIEIVKGGAIVDIGLRGFLPASLIETRRVRDLDPYLNKTMDFKIIELDKQRNNVVLSHRAIVEESEIEERSKFMEGLEVGQIRKGVVSSITNFGAFIDLGGVDGLVHVSELSWNHVDHPSEVVKVGQEVTVEVTGIEDDRERVSLSIKATQEDPWQIFARNHAIGQIVPGQIVKLVTFGAFIKVADGIEGLVHISELSNKHIASADQIAKVGDNVFAKIVDIDLERRRISLSIKQANDMVDPESEEFDPALYGAATDFDEQGNYIYPEGFDPETNEWKAGFEEQKAAWEANYLQARKIWEAHRVFIKELREKEANVEESAPEPVKAKRTRKKSNGDQSFGETEHTTALGDNADLAALKESLSA